MKILLAVGHSILKNGNCTSADGRPFGGVLEYAYNKNMVQQAAEYLRKAGHQVEVLLCPEKQFVKSSEERSYKLPRINAGNYDLVVELHLNASKYHNGKGCEVLYLCEEGKRIAQRIQRQLSTVFRDRGIKFRDNLYMLNSTKPVALIVESFFCDNSADCALAEKADVARLIAEGIHGKAIAILEEEGEDGRRPDEILYRVQVGAFRVRGNALSMQEKLLAAGFDACVVES